VARPNANADASTGSVASRPEQARNRRRHHAVRTTSPEVTTGKASSDPGVDALVLALGAHRPGDEREAQALAETLVSLAELPRPFDRNADLTHVTASAVVIGRRGVLLHRHRRLRRWMQPGGHLEPGETPEVGARRESVEETGLDLNHPGQGPLLVHVDVHTSADEHVHLDIRYLLYGPDADPAPPPGESQEVRWFSWREAEAIADQALVGALRSARRLSPTGSLLESGRTSEETDG